MGEGSEQAFTRFEPTLVGFLRELEANNERPWFQANKGRYEAQVLAPALAFVEAVGARLPVVSPHFLAIPRRTGGSVMRVYRDTRFGGDKRPYKTNLGIQFRHEVGKDVHAPGFYFHVDPSLVFLGAGMWRPDRGSLGAIRERIVERGEEWVRARDALLDAGFRLGGESLKRAPRGFDADHPLIGDLRRTDFIGAIDLDHADLGRDSVVDDVVGHFARAAPLVEFLCRAIGVRY